MIDWSQMMTAEARAERALASARAEAAIDLRAAVSAAAQAVTGDVPAPEIASWGTKAPAAQRWLDGTASPYDERLILAEAATSGRSPDDLAARIVANAEAYGPLISAMTGARLAAAKRIAAAVSVEEVEAARDAGVAAIAAAVTNNTGG